MQGTAKADARGAESDALAPADPDLAAITEAWPTLPPAIRRAIVALIGSIEPGFFTPSPAPKQKHTAGLRKKPRESK